MIKNVSPNKKNNDAWKIVLIYCVILVACLLLGTRFEHPIELSFSGFVDALNERSVSNLSIGETEITGDFIEGAQKGHKFFVLKVDPQLAAFLSSHNATFKASHVPLWQTLGGYFGPTLLILFVLGLLLERGGAGGAGTGFAEIKRSGAKIYKEESIKTTFADVAGVDEAKEDLTEVLNFLKHPEDYRKLGGHLPKGILLVGPPGTGKTLLARAVAGEAGVPFFSISGSQFVELFVGVGAARVRDLFAQAQMNTPCIIFIDELDALGKSRGGPGSAYGTHDEKEQTLNQLLVELDGFDPMKGIILLAATNRPEMLDAALLRAGRFDKHIVVDRPDKIGRLQILRVHLKNVAADSSVDPDGLAASTPGLTGADLANLINEAVLHAVRRKSNKVQASDSSMAMERIIAGPEKKNRLLNQQEREIVAHHECGHAIVSLFLPGNDVVQKVSIIPRGIGALGYTLQQPAEDRFLASKQELDNRLAVLLGGRAAEIVAFGRVTTGSADDLVKATQVARDMVTRYGLCAAVGPVSYESAPEQFLGNGHTDYAFQISEETSLQIDRAVKLLLENALQTALTILESNKGALVTAAKQLLQHETLTGSELRAIVFNDETLAESCSRELGKAVAFANAD